MSNEYDFQSYLYPAGSTSSGGGAGSGSGTGAAPAPAGSTDLTASAILKALGTYPYQRIQALLPQFEAAHITSNDIIRDPDNNLYSVNFKTPFKDAPAEKYIVLVSYYKSDGSSTYIKAVTDTGFQLGFDYFEGFRGLSYIKFVAP